MTTAIKERPILFSAPMVKAILAGTKTQTRRVYKGFYLGTQPAWPDVGKGSCRYGRVGERLWVREAFAGPCRGSHSTAEYRYRATDSDQAIPYRGAWKPGP